MKKHEAWVNDIQSRYLLNEENIGSILKIEVGKVFARVLEHAGIYERSMGGRLAFMRFIEFVNQED